MPGGHPHTVPGPAAVSVLRRCLARINCNPKAGQLVLVMLFRAVGTRKICGSDLNLKRLVDEKKKFFA